MCHESRAQQTGDECGGSNQAFWFAFQPLGALLRFVLLPFPPDRFGSVPVWCPVPVLRHPLENRQLCVCVCVCFYYYLLLIMLKKKRKTISPKDLHFVLKCKPLGALGRKEIKSSRLCLKFVAGVRGYSPHLLPSSQNAPVWGLFMFNSPRRHMMHFRFWERHLPYPILTQTHTRTQTLMQSGFP